MAYFTATEAGTYFGTMAAAPVSWGTLGETQQSALLEAASHRFDALPWMPDYGTEALRVANGAITAAFYEYVRYLSLRDGRGEQSTQYGEEPEQLTALSDLPGNVAARVLPFLDTTRISAQEARHRPMRAMAFEGAVASPGVSPGVPGALDTVGVDQRIRALVRAWALDDSLIPAGKLANAPTVGIEAVKLAETAVVSTTVVTAIPNDRVTWQAPAADFSTWILLGGTQGSQIDVKLDSVPDPEEVLGYVIQHVAGDDERQSVLLPPDPAAEQQPGQTGAFYLVVGDRTGQNSPYQLSWLVVTIGRVDTKSYIRIHGLTGMLPANSKFELYVLRRRIVTPATAPQPLAVKDFARVGGPAISEQDTDFADDLQDAVDILRCTWNSVTRVLHLESHDGTTRDFTISAGTATSGLTQNEVDGRVRSSTNAASMTRRGNVELANQSEADAAIGPSQSTADNVRAMTARLVGRLIRAVVPRPASGDVGSVLGATGVGQTRWVPQATGNGGDSAGELTALSQLPRVAGHDVGDIVNVNGELWRLANTNEALNEHHGTIADRTGNEIGDNTFSWEQSPANVDFYVPVSVVGSNPDSTLFIELEVPKHNLYAETGLTRRFRTTLGGTSQVGRGAYWVYTRTGDQAGLESSNAWVGAPFIVTFWQDEAKTTPFNVRASTSRFVVVTRATDTGLDTEAVNALIADPAEQGNTDRWGKDKLPADTVYTADLPTGAAYVIGEQMRVINANQATPLSRPAQGTEVYTTGAALHALLHDDDGTAFELVDGARGEFHVEVDFELTSPTGTGWGLKASPTDAEDRKTNISHIEFASELLATPAFLGTTNDTRAVGERIATIPIYNVATPQGEVRVRLAHEVVTAANSANYPGLSVGDTGVGVSVAFYQEAGAPVLQWTLAVRISWTPADPLAATDAQVSGRSGPWARSTFFPPFDSDSTGIDSNSVWPATQFSFVSAVGFDNLDGAPANFITNPGGSGVATRSVTQIILDLGNRPAGTFGLEIVAKIGSDPATAEEQGSFMWPWGGIMGEGNPAAPTRGNIAWNTLTIKKASRPHATDAKTCLLRFDVNEGTGWCNIQVWTTDTAENATPDRYTFIEIYGVGLYGSALIGAPGPRGERGVAGTPGTPGVVDFQVLTRAQLDALTSTVAGRIYFVTA